VYPKCSRVPFATLFVALLSGLVLSGCGEQESVWYEGIYDLSNVPISADLAPHLAEAVAALSATVPGGEAVEMLRKYEDLSIRVKSPTESKVAGDEVYRLWEQDPKNFLWLEVAKNNNRHLRRSDDLKRMCSLPVLSDTTTAVGAYVAARLQFKQTDRGQMFRRVVPMVGELDTLQQVWLGFSLASVDYSTGDAVGSVRRLLGLLPMGRTKGGPLLESTVWFLIAGRLTSMDRLDDALHALTMAKATALRAGSPYRLLRAEIKTGDLMEARREYAGALEVYRRSIESAEASGFTWLTQVGLSRSAGICTELGDYEQALSLDRRNLAIVVARNDPLNLPRGLANVAHSFRMMGHLDSCYVYLQRAGKYVDENSDSRNRAKMATLLAEYYCLVGAYDVADSLLLSAKGLSTTGGSERHEGRLLLELIPAAIEMGWADRAYAWLARVEELENSLHDGGFDQNLRADFAILTTRLLAYQGEFGRAVEALARADKEVAIGGGEGKYLELKILTGELAALREDLDSAREAFSEGLILAEASGRPEQISTCRFRLANVLLEEGKHERLRALFATPSGVEDFGPRFRNRLSSMLWLGMSAANEGDHRRALERFKQALDLCSPHSPSDLVARLKIEQSRSLAALGRASEAQKILEALHGSLAPNTARSGLAELQMFQSTALRDATEILIGIYLDHPRMAGNRSLGELTQHFAWPCFSEGRDFPPDTAGDLQLMFFVGQDRSFAWVTGSTGIAIHELPGRQELRHELRPLLADMTTPGRPIDRPIAEAVSVALLGPLADAWQAGETLYILPDGLLRDVPWAGLFLPPEFGSWAGRSALEFGPIVEFRATAPRQPEIRPVSARALSLLAVGCDVGGSADGESSLSSLRRAELEARRTAESWPGTGTVLRVGAEASWGNLASLDLQEFGVIHLATHAVTYPGQSHRSTLRLAAAGGAEPVTIEAVAGLQLDAELVFLSCCNAARRLSNAAAAADFADAFLNAGAQTVIASTLWVDDEASAYLAESFYRNWLDGKSRAEALRASLLELREARQEWSHSAYWAFYRLIGDPG
jgi:CHAT domain-containing protein/tetratricopeptide (TPR) repeat protein